MIARENELDTDFAKRVRDDERDAIVNWVRGNITDRDHEQYRKAMTDVADSIESDQHRQIENPDREMVNFFLSEAGRELVGKILAFFDKYSEDPIFKGLAEEGREKWAAFLAEHGGKS